MKAKRLSRLKEAEEGRDQLHNDIEKISNSKEGKLLSKIVEYTNELKE